MTVKPYLNFDGRTEEAVEFYRQALGAEVTFMMRFKESPQQEMTPPGSGDKVMHTTFRIGESELHASDGRCMGKGKFEGIALSLAAADAEQADRWFAALADGGKVQMPMSQTFFAKRFGMLADRFGVQWMVIAER